MSKTFKNVFVTVGTTRFDRLLAEIDNDKVQKTLFSRLGTRRLVVQVGKSEIKPKCTKLIYLFLIYLYQHM